MHNLKDNKIACLTLDVEADYGSRLDKPRYEGLYFIGVLVDFLKKRNIPLTCFVQGSIFDSHPDELQKFNELDIEFELHSFSHPTPQEMDIELEVKKGKEAYRRFLNKDPIGYRAPQGAIKNEDYNILSLYGFKYDSSIFPSIKPGVFNNLSKPTKPHIIDNLDIIEFPFTVFSKIIRIPIALSYIKLLGSPYFFLLKTFKLPNLIIFDFHLHDLFQLSSLNDFPFKQLPPIYRNVFRRIHQDGKDGLLILDKFITMLQKKGYRFDKLINVYEEIFV